jgi:type IV secretion system protein VirB10
MTPDMDSPSGLDLHPHPPAAVRVRKSVGIAAIAVVGLFLLAIFYGIYDRQHRQLQANSQMDIDRKAIPATPASVEFTSKLLPGEPLLPNHEVPLLAEQSNGATSAAGALFHSPAGSSPKAATGSALRTPPLTIPSYGLSSPNSAEQPDDREQAFADQREQEAIEAPTGIGGNRGYMGNVYAATPASSSIPQSATGVGPGISIPVASVGDSKTFPGAGQPSEYLAQNAQDQKSSFIAQARNRTADNYLNSTRTPPLTRFEIKAGWDIPAILEQAINSDEPGELKALVRENVYDTATGKYLLIPQGSRLTGTYNSVVSYGQDGVQAVWDRVIFPDASSLNLNGMIGQDAKGEAGLRYSVDHHYARLLGFAVLTSLFSAGFQLSQNRPGTILATPSTGEIIGGAVGSQVSQLGVEITRRNLNVQPTIKVPAGYRFNVRVNRDIVFNEPYERLR